VFDTALAVFVIHVPSGRSSGCPAAVGSLSHSLDFGPPNIKTNSGFRVKWRWFGTQSGAYGRREVASRTSWELFLALIAKVAGPQMFSPQHGFGAQIRRTFSHRCKTTVRLLLTSSPPTLAICQSSPFGHPAGYGEW
jgi:hypothetical protein